MGNWFWNSSYSIWYINAKEISIVKELLKDLNKAFENKIRIGIMSALYVNEFSDFKTLKNLIDVTDGNLASHLKYLEKSEYITYEKEFLNRKPYTKYYATKEGKDAFKKHIQAIEQLLTKNNSL